MRLSKSGSSTFLAVTPGEPAGIGPDVVLEAVAGDPALRSSVVVIADRSLLEARADSLSLTLSFRDWTPADEPDGSAVNLIHVPLRHPAVAGLSDPRNAPYVIETLETAVSACNTGSCAAMVTGPVNKAVINNGGIAFSGHTEWLQDRCGAEKVVMLLATDGLMVALATTHLPLREVPDAITSGGLRKTIEVLGQDLKRSFGLETPRILVLGLNPHAGEQGHLGSEEINVITPLLEEMRGDGYRLTGPVPADTAFSKVLLDQHDAVLAMYHDQGLPVLKFKGFGAAANITLGLPIIRTSVDHGTAESLAGTGNADAGGFRTAAAYALKMAAARC